MSHFSVAIVHRAEESLDDLLAPYYEGGEDDLPEGVATFVDDEDEMLKEYETEGTVMYKSPEGLLFSGYDEQFRIPGQFGVGTNTHKVPDNYTPVTMLHKNKFATFEMFAEHWYGRSQRDATMGRYGYWHNENAKWDWWTLGGRWNGLLKLKKGAKPFVRSEKAEPGYCNSAYIRDIDFAAMNEEARIQAERIWEKASTEGDENTAWKYDVKKGETKESYMARSYGFTTYAVLIDGEWDAKGKMGWFGISLSAEYDKDEFEKNYHKFIAKLVEERPDYVFSVVDCHI